LAVTSTERLRRLSESPLGAHVISVASLVLASVAVFMLFRFGEWAVETVNHNLPLEDPAPSDFLRWALSWGGAIITAATAMTASYYEVRTLIARLKQRRTAS
jgi:uncharacterized membrane protein YdjX (TVP38/TMEM64 family)